MFIVLYDDEMGLVWPASWDPDCEGGLIWGGSEHTVALFPDRASAKKSLKISRLREELALEQGLPHDETFIPKRASTWVIRPIAACKLFPLSPAPPDTHV